MHRLAWSRHGRHGYSPANQATAVDSIVCRSVKYEAELDRQFRLLLSPRHSFNVRAYRGVPEKVAPLF